MVLIYELGTFAVRRPFFAMKLVKGHTLTQLLEDRKDPAHGLPRFLSIFEAVYDEQGMAGAVGRCESFASNIPGPLNPCPSAKVLLSGATPCNRQRPEDL